MKLSKDTLSILKNFANINDGLMFRQGNVLRTCDAQKQILAETTISETVPNDFGVYDLNRFLSALDLEGENSTLEFDASTKSVVVSAASGRSKTFYRICDATNIKNAPDKAVNMPTPDVTFQLTQEDLEHIVKASGRLATPHVAIKSDGSKIFLHALDNKNTSTHTNELEIGNGNGKRYAMLFKTENLKMIPGTYDVSISFKGIASFKNTTKQIQYWIATEIGSSSEA
jgi:hypothetical protein